MKIVRPFIFAVILAGAGAAASADPAEAATIFRPGVDCIAQQGYEVGYDNLGVHSVPPNSAYIYCFTNQALNIRRVDVKMLDNTSETSVICVVWGERNGVKTFGPSVIGTGATFTGEKVVGLNVSASNDTRLLVLNCNLPAPTNLGASYLRSYVITTR